MAHLARSVSCVARGCSRSRVSATEGSSSSEIRARTACFSNSKVQGAGRRPGRLVPGSCVLCWALCHRHLLPSLTARSLASTSAPAIRPPVPARTAASYECGRGIPSRPEEWLSYLTILSLAFRPPRQRYPRPLGCCLLTYRKVPSPSFRLRLRTWATRRSRSVPCTTS